MRESSSSKRIKPITKKMIYLSRSEQLILALAASALSFCLYLSFKPIKAELRNEIPVGRVSILSGDVRYQESSSSRHFKVWRGQRLYKGDALYAGESSILKFSMGEIPVKLHAFSLAKLSLDQNWFGLELSYGEVEVQLPAGERLRLRSRTKLLEMASVNGSRVTANVDTNGNIQIQSVSGDVVISPDGQAPYTINNPSLAKSL